LSLHSSGRFGHRLRPPGAVGAAMRRLLELRPPEGTAVQETVEQDVQCSTTRMAMAWHALDRALAGMEQVDLSWLTGMSGRHRWALAPDALRLLASLVRHLRPRHVLEFGSGLSTQVLTWASQGLPDCRIASIDHDPEFSEAAARQLSEACPGADR